MLVLALETSGTLGGVAVMDERGLRANVCFSHQRDLSRRMPGASQDALRRAGCALGEIAGLAVCAGPGSFTGLRVGVTMAKTLAFALEIPVVGVGTLEAVAAGVTSTEGTPLYVVQEASATELFAGTYLQRKSGTECVSADRFTTATQWLDELCILPPGIVLGVLGRHRERIAATLGDAFFVAPTDEGPRVAVVAQLGRRRLLAGEAESPHLLAPRYLRVSTPEARLLATEARG